MNLKLINLLSEFGLSANEAGVYLALIELGNGTVSDIAKRSHVKRTSIYFILEKLTHLGLVYQTKIDTKTYYMAEKPEQLLRQYEDKIGRLKDQLDNFRALAHRGSLKPKVTFYDSEEGFKKIWQDLFASGEKLYLNLTDPREMLHFVEKNYITGKIIKKKMDLGIKSLQLVTASEYAKEIIAKDEQENRKSRVLPLGYRTPYTTLIFGEKVALVSPLAENIIMMVDSRAYAETERSKFMALWNLLPGGKTERLKN